LLAFLATALLSLTVVRLWLKLEKGALAILELVRTCASLRRSIPGQRFHCQRSGERSDDDLVVVASAFVVCRHSQFVRGCFRFQDKGWRGKETHACGQSKCPSPPGIPLNRCRSDHRPFGCRGQLAWQSLRWFTSTFNRPGFELFDYDVYALCGDGCMMEGISGEGVSGRAPQTRQPVLDLRQQPHHHRGNWVTRNKEGWLGRQLEAEGGPQDLSQEPRPARLQSLTYRCFPAPLNEWLSWRQAGDS